MYIPEPRPPGRAHLVVMALLTAAIVFAFFRLGSDPIGFVESKYERAKPRGDFERGSDVFTSDDPPALVGRELLANEPPPQRYFTATAWYLRYSDHVVAIRPDGNGGTRITVDGQKRGIRRHHVATGDRWSE